MSIVELAFIEITLVLHSVSFFLIMRSWIYTDWLSFIVFEAVSQLICYLIIVWTSLRSFVLYFFKRDFFNTSRVSILSNTNKKSSMYIFTILVLFSDHMMRMLGSFFSCTNPIFCKILWYSNSTTCLIASGHIDFSIVYI